MRNAYSRSSFLLMIYYAVVKSTYAIGVVAIVAVVAAAALGWCCPLLTTDTCCRYAPMAEAFATGAWEQAFHPRFGFGTPILAGSFCYLTGADGYVACTVVAMVAWALGIIPLFFLTRRIFDVRTAWFAVILYLGGPTILLWSLKGLRESFKVLGLLLMADALFASLDRRQGKSCRGDLLEASLGLALLVFFKVDSVVFALLFVALYLWLERFSRRGWILLGELVLMLQPCCFLVYDWTGVWVPVVQFAVILKQAFGG